jgi:hypothetical protein
VSLIPAINLSQEKRHQQKFIAKLMIMLFIACGKADSDYSDCFTASLACFPAAPARRSHSSDHYVFSLTCSLKT